MKAGMLFTTGGPLVILTSHNSFTDARLVRKLRAKGIEKFIVYPDSARIRRPPLPNGAIRILPNG